MDTSDETPLSDRELVLQFESLGDNCEFGLVQRRIGVEPLSLFRFSGARLRKLLPALNARFEGMADPDNFAVETQNGEYMIRLTRFGFLRHTDMKIEGGDPDILLRQQPRVVGFLIDKFISDLERPEKIMVFRQNEEVSANNLLDLRAALAAYGPVTLLWVQEARPGHPPGSVSVVDETLIIGYLTRLAPRGRAPDLDLQSWMTMLRNVYEVRPPRFGGTGAIRRQPRKRIDIVFGREGNSAAYTCKGWSSPEDGFTWSIDDRSVLIIGPLAAAAGYRLEMEVGVFVAPPAVTAQAMDVTVNGVPVHGFDPLARGKVACSIPGHLIAGRETNEIVLDHPRAISPKVALGRNDDRRLAVSFNRLSLVCEADPDRPGS
jgi:hypothetical protein